MRNLKALRLHLGRTIAEAALAAHIDATTYQRIERGRINPTPAELERIAAALGVADPAWLLHPFEFAVPSPAAEKAELAGAR